MNCHASYSLSLLGTTIFFASPCPRLFPPECRVECLSDHGRHECVLPFLLALLSSPLLILVLTAESTVLASLFVIRLRRGASENLFCAVSVRARPCLLHASVYRENGGEAKKVRLSRVANPFGLGMRRSIRDIGVVRPRDTRGRIQGRIHGVLGGTCSCGGLVCQVPFYDLLPCLRSRTQYWVEPRLDGPTRVGGWASLKTIPPASQIEVRVVFPVDGRAIYGLGGLTLLGCCS